MPNAIFPQVGAHPEDGGSDLRNSARVDPFQHLALDQGARSVYFVCDDNSFFRQAQPDLSGIAGGSAARDPALLLHELDNPAAC